MVLNDDDRRKLAFLNHLVLIEKKDPVREEVIWLLDRLRMNLSHPDEFEFPDYACLVNKKDEEAYALRRFLKPDWSAHLDVAENTLSEGVETFFLRTNCIVNNAFLVVRPWVRVHPNTSEDTFEKLRRCTITAKFDDDALVNKAPIDDYLIAKDGGGIRAYSPFINPIDNKYVYIATLLDKDNFAVLTSTIGIFLARYTIVRIEITAPPDLKHERFQIVSGFTAMEYTTLPDDASTALSHPRELMRLGK